MTELSSPWLNKLETDPDYRMCCKCSLLVSRMFELSMNSELVVTTKKKKNNKCSLKINLNKWVTGLKILCRNPSRCLV
jgi:hypothetical protein